MPVTATAYDGSLWVTAASSVALVMASAGLAVAGGMALARKAASGGLQLTQVGGQPESVQRSRSIALEKESGGDKPTELPPPAGSVDRLE